VVQAARDRNEVYSRCVPSLVCFVKQSSITEISIIHNIPASKTKSIESHFHP